MGLSNVKLGPAAERPDPDPSNAGDIYIATDTDEVTFSKGSGAPLSAGASNIDDLAGVDVSGIVVGSTLASPDGVELVATENVLIDDAAGTVLIESPSPADSVLEVRVDGDTEARILVQSGGQINFGAGGAAFVDTSLYRNDVGELKTDTSLIVGTDLQVDDALVVSGGVEVSGGAGVQISGGGVSATNLGGGGNVLSASKPAGIAVQLTTDELKFADGAGGSLDTNLYRASSNVLKTDDSLIVDIDLLVGGNSELGNAAGDTVRFHGTAQPGTQAALVADATDEASAIVLVNALKACLVNHGLMADA